MERVILTKDGRLLERRWKYDHEKEEGATSSGTCRTSGPSASSSGARSRARPPWTASSGSWSGGFDAVETVFGRRGTELLSDARAPLAEDAFMPDDKPLDYLELYWHFEEDDDERTFGGFAFPDLHGVRRGEDVQYGVEFVPANEMLGLRLRLRSFAKVYPGHKAIMAAYRGEEADGTPVPAAARAARRVHARPRAAGDPLGAGARDRGPAVHGGARATGGPARARRGSREGIPGRVGRPTTGGSCPPPAASAHEGPIEPVEHAHRTIPLARPPP